MVELLAAAVTEAVETSEKAKFLQSIVSVTILVQVVSPNLHKRQPII